MSAKRKKSAPISSRMDDAPEITARWAAEADLYSANTLVRRGRPKLADPKRLLSVRIRTSTIEAWKATGAGWQTRMTQLLESATPPKPAPVGRGAGASAAKAGRRKRPRG
jgi:uncharacterized protein (DUF4415 family)